MGLKSCLYETNIMHCRIRPKRHVFNHRVFMFYLDLDELDILSKTLRLFGRNQARLYNFRDDDHFNADGQNIKGKVLGFLKDKGMADEIGKIMLLTNARVFGYVFNPVSFYFCFDPNGAPLCVVPEVGNTFGEIKPFYIGPRSFENDRFTSQMQKHFYISPFVDLDVFMDMELNVPDEKINIKIDDRDVGGKFLFTVMSGTRTALTDKNLLRLTLRHPMVTLQVIMLIHLHALRLWLKKVPYHMKESNPHLQKEVYRVWKDGHRKNPDLIRQQKINALSKNH